MRFGIIHYRNIRNSTFVIKLDDNSFSVFEGFNLNEFNVGDMISGQLDKCGFFNILNATTQKTQLIHIQNIGCTETSAMEKSNSIV
jgi:hypothetical protein